MSRAQRPCRHPHGTKTRYAAGCSCIPCCDAWAAYQTGLKSGEIVSSRTDITVSQERLHYLLRSMTLGAVSRASGMCRQALRRIQAGNRKFVSIETETALLAVDPRVPGRSLSMVDSSATAALIARMRREHPLSTVAQQTGLAAAALSRIQHGHQGKRYVQARTATLVLEAAERLGVARSRERDGVRALLPDAFDRLVEVNGWEVEGLVAAAGLTPGAYGQIRAGRPVSEERAERLAIAAGVSVDTLFEEVA